MLKEKIENFLKGEGNNKKKIENLLFFLMILIVTVLAINFIWKDNTSQEEEDEDGIKTLATTVSNENVVMQETLESKLENILSNINGVGKVNVLLTYNESEEIIPIYNLKEKTSSTNEIDKSGGTRVVEETDSSKEVVYQNDKMMTQKKISPKIEGAVIIAEGANNAVVKSYIIQAVEAATGLATHKIQVFEKKN